MIYVILPNLQIVLFFVYVVLKNFEKVFICYLTMDYIIVYYTTIIPNTLDKVVDGIEFWVVKVG